jgi:hypothetical protein
MMGSMGNNDIVYMSYTQSQIISVYFQACDAHYNHLRKGKYFIFNFLSYRSKGTFLMSHRKSKTVSKFESDCLWTQSLAFFTPTWTASKKLLNINQTSMPSPKITKDRPQIKIQLTEYLLGPKQNQEKLDPYLSLVPIKEESSLCSTSAWHWPKLFGEGGKSTPIEISWSCRTFTSKQRFHWTVFFFCEMKGLDHLWDIPAPSC